MNQQIEGFRYYVRVTEIKDDKFVAFDFAINEPDLAVELVLPVPQFKEFCERYNTQSMSDLEGNLVDEEKAIWRTGEAFHDA